MGRHKQPDRQALDLSRRHFLQLSVPAGIMLSFARSSVGHAAVTNMVFGAAGGVSRFDPYLSTDLVENIAYFNVFDTPARPLPDNSLVPGLALSWSTTNPTTWVFKLRQGVTWHNGDPFTVEDVLFSLARVVDPESRSIFASNFAVIDKATAIDSHTLQITTKGPDPFMPHRLANYGSHVLPHKYFQSAGQAKFLAEPIGTGPYKLKEFTPGQIVVLERNPRYWDPPVMETITMRRLPELSARTAALKTGEVHLINGVSPDTVPQIDTKTTHAVGTLSGSAYFLPINMRTAPLNNRDLRHALSLAIDRESINKNLFGGQAQALNEPILPGSVGADPSRPKLAYDPDKAKDLVKKSGYRNEEIVFETLASLYFGNDRDIAEAMTAMWNAVGLNVKMSVLEPAVRAQKNSARAFNGLFAAYFGGQYNDAAGLLWRSMNPKGILAHYWNVPDVPGQAQFNELGERAVQVFDEAERGRLYKQMTDIFLDIMPWVLLFQPPLLYGSTREVKLSPGPNILLNFRKETLTQA